MTYPVFLQAVVIDSTNKAIRFKEGASTVTVSLTEGTYYLRGDGVTDDLLKAIKDAIDGAGATNTYTLAVAWSADPSAVPAVVTITQSGGATFQFLWADALTTFDEGLIGFTNVNTADNTTAKTSTLSPSAVWVGDGPHKEHEPIDRPIGFAKRSRAGKVRRGKTGTTRKDRRFAVSFVSAVRTHEQFNTTDPERCFNRFLDRWRAGKPVEFHLADITAGFALGALSSTTEQGATYQLGGDGDDEFEPRRQSNAVQLYSWTLELWENP
jgi:hypothetical protein